MTAKNRTELDFATDIDFSDILTNPILDIAARFWEEDRYRAFQVCYRSMRRIDDLVDHRKETTGEISLAEVRQFERMMSDWLEAVRKRRTDDQFTADFVEILDQFRIPFWPWERLYRSMVYDLKNDGFPTFLTFVRYTEGAAIAPASIFMHLCGIDNSDGQSRAPKFDIRLAARPLALFSYLVHIMRDFQKDQKAHLHYFADQILSANELTRNDLEGIAGGQIISDRFRNLMTQYVSFAEYYRQKARSVVDDITPLLVPRYQLSLELIYQLYHQIFERIDPENGNFTAEELMPAPDEVRDRIEKTVADFVPVRPV